MKKTIRLPCHFFLSPLYILPLEANQETCSESKYMNRTNVIDYQGPSILPPCIQPREDLMVKTRKPTTGSAPDSSLLHPQICNSEPPLG